MDFLPYLVDAVVVLIFVCAVLDGNRRGFVKMILSLVAAIISIALAGELSEPIAVRINDAYLHDIIVEEIDNNLNIDDITQQDIAGIEQAVPSQITAVADEAGISIEDILKAATEAEGGLSENLIAEAEENLIIPILTITVFAAVYILLMIVFAIIIGAINTAFKLPVLNKLNKALGAILGALKGVTVVLVISVVAVLTASFAPESELGEAVLDSVLLNKIFDITVSIIV